MTKTEIETYSVKRKCLNCGYVYQLQIVKGQTIKAQNEKCQNCGCYWNQSLADFHKDYYDKD